VVDKRSLEVFPPVPSITFRDRTLSRYSRALLVAEIGLNHCGLLERAVDLIVKAAECGADAVKFQKRCPKALLTADAYDQPYIDNGRSFGRTYGIHREALEFNFEQYQLLYETSMRHGLEFFVSVWDEPSMREMSKLDLPAIKIGSANLTDDGLLHLAASFEKPIFLSTGMSRIDEIDHAVSILQGHSAEFLLLHCISEYPTPIEDARLSTIPYLTNRYEVPVGYSGHELEPVAGVVALTLGACVIEKHFTLNRNWKGGDQITSLLPDEYTQMVRDIRTAEKALSGVRTDVLEGELPQRMKLGKSIVAACSIDAGEILSLEMMTSKCPGRGLSPQDMHTLIGKRVVKSLKVDDLVDENVLESGSSRSSFH